MTIIPNLLHIHWCKFKSLLVSMGWIWNNFYLFLTHSLLSLWQPVIYLTQENYNVLKRYKCFFRPYTRHDTSLVGRNLTLTCILTLYMSMLLNNLFNCGFFLSKNRTNSFPPLFITIRNEHYKFYRMLKWKKEGLKKDWFGKSIKISK